MAVTNSTSSSNSRHLHPSSSSSVHDNGKDYDNGNIVPSTILLMVRIKRNFMITVVMVILGVVHCLGVCVPLTCPACCVFLYNRVVGSLGTVE